MTQRNLSNQDILEMEDKDQMYLKRQKHIFGTHVEERRLVKDRRVAINSYVDPAMDRRFYNRRHLDK